MSPVQVNKNGSSFEELKTKLTPGQKYIIRDRWSKGVEGIPKPSTCLVYRGASYSEYVSCNNSFNDGCNESDGHPPFKVIIYIEENNIEGTTTYTSVVSSHVTIGDKNGIHILTLLL
ncbi:uncharacterized protein LOC133196736 [Saccostrea echinata]|uniref:uncharacterized protein LOC133196736 n=1 Tax=Saccostrea echinata TaxID=191078 RepID=UPI002A826D41|nr:uncharacterized protein LOC133196736 [Saccostrea echinata]